MDLFSNLLVIALLPAIGEELFFRGIVQKQFEELTQNRTAGIVLTALLFSALHMQFFGFIPRFVLGVFLGFLYQWSGTIWLPVTAHFINNAGAVILTWAFTRNNSSINPDTIGIEPGQELLLGISVFMSLAGVWLLRKNLVR
jgi:membrane protease YdiL (CAAX protease family)